MAYYVVSDSTLANIANIIREKTGLSAPIEFPNGFVNAIESISTDDENNFVVTIIMDENEMYAPDCSYDEIIDAYDAGKNICVVGYQEIFDLNNDGVVGFFDEDTQSLIYTVTHNISELNSQRKETLHYTLTADGLTVDPNEDIYYDAEDANALPNDVANGKIFYNSNGRAVGTHTSGPVSVPAKEVNFRDYDGTVVYSYTHAEFAALSAMPANPDHSGDEIPLTAQGWNWSFADAQAYVAKYGRLEVGQMYITTDGKTHILIHLEEGRTSPILGCCPNGTVDVDWGDGTAHDTLTGTSVETVKWTPTHNYSTPGDYDIKLTCTGTMGFFGGSGAWEFSGLLRNSSGTSGPNSAYQNAIHAIYCADDVVAIGEYAFYSCSSLLSITIPDSVDSIGQYAFYYCFKLGSIIIPNQVRSIGNYTFFYCTNMSAISLPKRVASIGERAFAAMYNLSNITIPDAVTAIGNSAFRNCSGLRNIIIPDSVVNVGQYVFAYIFNMPSVTIRGQLSAQISGTCDYMFYNCTGLRYVTILDGASKIGQYMFSYCCSLSSITIPDGVSSIGTYAFSSCYTLLRVTISESVSTIQAYAFHNCNSLTELHFLRATPPTVAASSAFSTIPIDCKIYVPTGSLAAYTSATNYPSSSTYTYIEE